MDFLAHRWPQGIRDASDPYNGSPVYGPSLLPFNSTNPLTNIGQEATASFTAAHFLNNDDVVTIAGVGGASASIWNGTFIVYGVTSTTFKYYMADIPMTGSADVTAALTRLVTLIRESGESIRVNEGVHPAEWRFHSRE